MSHHPLDTLKEFTISGSHKGKFHSLPALQKALGVNIERLPVSIRIVLESVLRNCDGNKVTEAHVRQLANWKPKADRTDEIPFVVARVVLQDFTGVPLLASNGTPVKSCSTTRATTNGISSVRSALGFQLASWRTWASVTLLPSQLRSTDSSTIRIDTGRRSIFTPSAFCRAGSE